MIVVSFNFIDFVFVLSWEGMGGKPFHVEEFPKERTCSSPQQQEHDSPQKWKLSGFVHRDST